MNSIVLCINPGKNMWVDRLPTDFKIKLSNKDKGGRV